MTNKVYVYRNLNKGGFSVMQRGKVIGVYDYLILRDVEFRVRKGGNARAMKEMQRNVHAFAVGTLEATDVYYAKTIKGKKMRRITYRPFTDKTFVYATTGKPITHAIIAEFTDDKVFVSNN